MRLILCAILLCALGLAGCASDPYETGTGNDATSPPGPAGYDTTGCTGQGRTGTGTGDIASDVSCESNRTPPTSSSG